jgi:hypothetical protein
MRHIHRQKAGTLGNILLLSNLHQLIDKDQVLLQLLKGRHIA